MKTTIVTAADTSHAVSCARLAGLVREQFPDARFDVWDLGMHGTDMVNIYEAHSGANIHNYPYGDMPAWHNVRKQAGEYGWKPQCVQMSCAMEPADIVIWLDAGNVIKNSLADEIAYAVEHGIYMAGTVGTIEEYTDPFTAWALTNGTKHKNRMRSGACIVFHKSRFDIIGTWAWCGRHRDIFAPIGSRKSPLDPNETPWNPSHHHRQDQAVLTCILANEPIPTECPPRWNWVRQGDIDKRPRNFQKG